VGESVLAQIVPDNTLGTESSVVTPIPNIQGIPSDQIDGGATRGANLFHSFSQFNISAGRGAYFTNPAGILNILTRVTGANRSEILGRLGVNGKANLFLINPNGIVFGQDASLDVQGSFLATTADAIKLGDAGLFSASQSATSNLLTVSPSALWFNAVGAQPIVNRSQAQSPIGQPNSNDAPPGLQVQPGRTLALVGGDVLLERGNLTAAKGRIELGSVAGVGQVSLSQSGNGFVLGYGSINDFGNISLSNGAFVDASGEGGGDVQIRGARLEMTQSSNIWANTLGAENGGEVLVRTTEIELSESSYLSANVTDTGTGTGGNLTIDTGRMLVRDGAEVAASTLGTGKGGSLRITAADSVEVGASADGRIAGRLSALSEGSGEAGNLTIDTQRLLVRDGAQVSAGTVAEGKGGSLLITAADSVEVIGTSADGQIGSVLSTQSEGSGEAGNLTIDTGRLLVRDGASVSANTLAEGKGGSLLITAADSVEVIGTSADGQIGSGLSALSEGSGDARNLTIDTQRLLVRDGAQVSAGSLGTGKGGSLLITASDLIELIGTTADGQFGSGLYTSSDNEAGGDAGDLTIETGRLLVHDGASVSASSFGAGKGGSLLITASDSVEVIGTSAEVLFASALAAQSDGSGDAGNLTIVTQRLLVRDGAQVSTGTVAEGSNGGSLRITASDSVEVIGTAATGVPSGLFTLSEEAGADAGDLTIETGRLLVRDGAAVSSATLAEGNGGSLQITASEKVEVIGTSADGQFGSGLAAISGGRGDAGDLTIDTPRLVVRDGATVSVGTRGAGKGGSLQITASEEVEVIGNSPDGQRNGLFARSAGSGNAGDLTIETPRLLVRDGAVISSGSIGEGTAGNIDIRVRNTLQADNGTIETASEQSSGGNITITASNIRLFGNSDITTRVNSGAGDSGDINLKAGSILAFEDSDILAYAENGTGGDITLDTPVFFGESYRRAPRNTDPDTLDRNNRVDVNATGAVEGVITIPDTTFIQNSLTELPENQIDTDSLLASSCIVRRNQPTSGSFTITGTGGLAQRPGDAQMSSYPTVDIETLPSDGTPTNTNPNRPWQKGDPIVEPQGVYRLPNGKLVLSRECP
jgi:filamentous hemagglutinin family protein